MILGVLDVLNYRNGTRHDDFVVGRDTGSDEFRGHIHAFGKFGKLADFVFVLDGDAAENGAGPDRGGGSVRPQAGTAVPAGRELAGSLDVERGRGPAGGEYAREYGLSASELRARLASIEQTFVGDANTRPQDLPKVMVRALSDELTRTVPDIARIVGKLETEAARGEMAAFSVGLTEQIDAWARQAGGR